MDILYIVGTGSTWDNNELRYSLRSICKYGKNVGDVYLVGNKPDFVSNEVHFLPCEDTYDHKHKNILHKIVKAAEEAGISRHFLISSDDHFYIRKTDFDKLPVHYKREQIQSEMKPDDPFNKYELSLVATRKVLEANGLPVYQTNPHCNTHWDMDVYQEYLHLFYKSYVMPFGMEANCLMGNMLIKKGAEPVPFDDCKVDFDVTEKDWDEVVGSANCISSVDDVKYTYMAEWLAKEFPDKCKYEK